MKETKQLILFLAAIGTQTVESATDGDGLNFKDAPEFIDELMQAPEALGGISEVPGEIKNSTSEERAELYQIISDEIQGLTPDRFDKFVEAAEQIAIAVDSVITQFRSEA